MVYFDARLSAQHPTLEIRVADVCLDVDDAVLLAALARALVETAVRAWRAGTPADPVRLELLRLAAWRAGRSGLDGVLLDPCSWRPAPATDVLGRLVTHLTPALDDAGDLGRGAGTAGRGAAARHGSAGPKEATARCGRPAGRRGAGGAPHERVIRPPGDVSGSRRPAVARERSRALRTASQTSPTTTSPSTT